MIIKKWNSFLFYTDEEKWLNEMAAKGYHLVKYSFYRYHFEIGEPGKYEYRMELLNAYPTSPIGTQYINFMKDVGVECVDTRGRWAYFRRVASDEPFEIYTDNTSKKKHLNRVLASVFIFALLNLYIMIANTFFTNEFQLTDYIVIFNWVVEFIFIYIIVKYFKMKRKLKASGQKTLF